MTAIAGAVHLDGRPADSGLAARMLGALAHRGGVPHVTCAGPAALGTRRVRPLPDASPRPSIAFHGVLYDRDALAAELGLSSHGVDDAQLAAAAYARWDAECALRLSGDFSFVLWDERTASLFGARDVMGVRPFYYAVADRTFIFASELHALFEHPALGRTPNIGLVAEILSDQVRSRTESLFVGIERLPAAHVLTASGAAVRTRRYWSAIDPDREAVPDGEPAGAEALRVLLDRAVTRRTAGQDVVGIELSGGLDSAAVTALAAVSHGGRNLRAYTIAHGSPHCDETAFARLSARAAGCPSRMIEPAPWDPDWVESETSRYLDWPGGPNGLATDRVMYFAAAADGIAVLLTGEGGDEWFSGSRYRYADLMEHGRFATLARELWAAPAFSTAWRRLLFAGVWPLLPGWTRSAARRVAGRRAGGPRLAPWLTREFVRDSGLEDRRRHPEYDARSGMTRASWDIAHYLDEGWLALAFELGDRATARFGLEERHPFFDRDLVAFALALPESARYRSGESKRILRRALRGIVPDAILARRDKAEYSHLYVQALEALGGESAFDRLAIVEAGWVRPAVLGSTYRRALAAYQSGGVADDLGALWSVLAMDAWFRQAILRSPAPAGVS